MDCIREWLADICLVGAAAQSCDRLIVEQRPVSGIIGVTATYKGRTYQGCAIFRVESVELPCEWYGCSGDVDSMDFYVTNNDPSRAGEPVEFCLEFEGDEGYYDCDWSGTLDVVKYRVEADANWPSNKVRHFFGPLETFKAII
ncbi:MAG: hypothetical protein IKQ17_00120, partial [Kiritimatiellae bacterium]|nr:hypothetical protein [Kiritimatiellia bacterium]